jgi:hypothetical protein
LGFELEPEKRKRMSEVNKRMNCGTNRRVLIERAVCVCVQRSV